MSAQAHDFAPSKRQMSDLQRKMAEFDANKAKSVSIAEDNHVPHKSKSPKRDNTPHPGKGTSGPFPPPSPDRQGEVVAPYVRGSHNSPPPSDDEREYKKNILKTGGNGRDGEEKWIGDSLPRPRTHSNNQEVDLSYADSIKVSGGRGKDTVVEWNGAEEPRITHHHKWTDDSVPSEATSKSAEKESRKKKEPKVRTYRNADGDYVAEADGSDNELNTHHVWTDESPAQKALDKKSKKSSRRSSHHDHEDRAHHSGEESEFSTVRRYTNRDGDEVQEATRPDDLKIGHNHQWTD